MPSINEKTQKAGQIYAQLKDLLSSKNLLVWHEAELWYSLKKDNLYKYVFGEDIYADNVKSWRAFIAEAGIPISTVDYKIECYQKWVKELGYKMEELNVDVKKLRAANSFAVSKRKKADEILEQAKVLSFNDFIIWLNGNEDKRCWHLNKEIKEEKIKVCKDCGKKLK